MVSFFSFGGNKIGLNKINNSILLRNDTISTYNSAAIGSNAFWNGGLNFTSVGTNGKKSYYGTFDQTGLVWEWCDGNSTSYTYKVIRGGDIAGFGGYSNKYDSDKSRRYLKTVAGGDINPRPFLSVSNKGKGKPQDQDWGGRIVSLTNPLNLDNYVTVGDINNANDTTGYGGVSYTYQISRYLLTNDEYCVFLNAKASSDPNSLYSSQMSSERVGGINRTGSSGSYTYSVKTNMGNKPVYFLSWFSLARYCNWLHNGKGSGSTETGAYTLNNTLTGIINKNAGALYYIPTENEWYKAAYYKGGSTNAGYWSFATQSNSVPTLVAASLIGDGTVKNVSIKPVSSVGSNVNITGINDSIYNTIISLTYQQVSSSGVTKITPVTQNDPKLPVNFSLSNNLAKYNISTTSARSGNIDLCFTLPSGITSTTFNKTKIFHTDSKGVTTDITITSGANAPNYSTRTICGRSTSFSDFHIIPSNDIASYPIPTNISGIPGNGKIDLSWSISDPTDIFDYDIKYSIDSGNAWITFQHLSTTGNSLSVDGLTNNTPYLFKIASVGVSGISDYSTDSPYLSPIASVPDAVTGVSATADINSAIVSWNVPNNNGSIISNYTIQYSSDNGSTWTNSSDALILFADDISTTRNLTINNLNPSNSYIFRVSASNGAGIGSYSTSSNSIIPITNSTATATPTPTVTPTISTTATPTPTVTPTATPTSSPAAVNNGIIIQSLVNSTPRALIGGGVNYNAPFIDSNYKAYFSNIVNQFNNTLVNGSLPYDNIHGIYINNTNSYGYPWYYNFIVPTTITKYRLWNAFKSGIPFVNSVYFDRVNFINVTRYSDYGNQTPQGWKLQGSLDGVSWTDVDTRTNQARLPYATSSDPSSSAYNEYAISSPAAYKVYRFLVTAGSRNGYNCGKGGCEYYDWQLGQLQLWGYESPTTSCGLHGYYSSLPIAKYITSSGSLSNSSFRYAFYNSGFLGHDSRITAFGFQPDGRSYHYTRTWDHYYRINTAVGQYITEYIGFDYPIVLNGYNIRCVGDMLTSWDIYGSNDLSLYTLLDSRTGQNTSSISTTFSFSNSTSYKYFKFVFKSGTQVCYKNGCFWSANISDIILQGTLV